MRKLLSLLAIFSLFSYAALAQLHTVSGVVHDEKGSAIPFATVSETGKKNAAVADANGNFSIKIAQGSTLTITATGYRTTTVTPTGATVTVEMPVTLGELSEVLVTTAFGIKRAQRITPYSSQVLKSEQINIIPQSNLNNALAGKVAGAQFRGQSPMKLDAQGGFRLRGGLFLEGDVPPLYVVDGTPSTAGGSFSFDINPDDIEDVTVLKGANATALFGEQAKAGAIVITTKKGSGAGKGTSIEVNQGVTFDKTYILPQFQNTYAGGAAADLINFTWAPGMPDEWKPLDGKRYPDYTDDASWGPRMVGQEYVPWYAWIPGTQYTGKTAKLLPQPDNVKDFFRTGVASNTNIAFGKSNQGSNFRMSYTNNTITGMLPNSSSHKNTLYTSGSAELNSHFTVAADVTFSSQKIKGEFDDTYANQSSGSFTSWFHRDLDMNIMKQMAGVRTPIGTYPSWNLAANPSSGSAASAYKGNYWYNYYTYFDLLNNITNRDRLYGSASVQYALNKNFKVKATVRKNSLNTVYENTTPSELEASAVQTGLLASYATGVTRYNEMNYEALASYNQSFLGKMNVSLNAGVNQFKTNLRTGEMATSKGLNVPGLYAISNSKQQPTNTNTRQQTEVRSVFGSGDIEWNKILDATFAVRNDWYSTLLPGNNSLLSPSAGLSFFFSDFTRDDAPWLSFGKVFGSWGKKPTSLGVYQTNFLYGVNQYQWNFKGANYFLMSTPNTNVDPAIQGALVTTYEAGLDLRFLKNRYGLNIVYYNETAENSPQNIAVAGYGGFTNFLTNTGLVKRTGLEVVATARAMTRKDFSWDISATFAYLLTNPVEKTTATGDDIQIASGAFFSGIVPPKVYQSPGKAWGQLRGTAIKRNDQGLPVVNPATGAYVTDNNHYFGSVVPRTTGGFVNTLTYKKFSFNFNLDYQFGGKFFSLSEMWGTYSGLLAPTAATNDKGWNVRDDVSVGGGVHVTGVSSVDLKTPVDMYIPADVYFHGLGGGNAIADPFLHSLSYVKLREVSVGYQLPVEKWGSLSKTIKGITAAIIARNPLVIYRETKNFDPSEISATQGEDGQLPGTRGIGFNLKFIF